MQLDELCQTFQLDKLGTNILAGAAVVGQGGRVWNRRKMSLDQI